VKFQIIVVPKEMGGWGLKIISKFIVALSKKSIEINFGRRVMV
jgi:hypothetical protein